MDEINDPSWPEILRACQDQLAARLHTSLPGIVRAYDVATQTATVQLAIQLGGVTVPEIPGVPVVWSGGAAGFLHVPLAAGDTVLVVFSEEDPSKWLTTGSVSAPAILARHGLHAVAIPGLRPAGAALAVTGGHVTLAAAVALHLGSDTAANFVALANLVDDRLAAIRSAFNAHVHVETGASTNIPTTLLGVQATVAATKVKAQ